MKKLREKVEEELAELEYLDLVEIKFLDACRYMNAKLMKISNSVFATYKKVVGWFLSVKLDKLYHEPHLIIITEQTNGRVNIVSIPVKVVMKVVRLPEGSYRKEMSAAGTPYLQGGRMSKYRLVTGGIGEIDEDAEEKVANGR